MKNISHSIRNVTTTLPQAVSNNHSSLTTVSSNYPAPENVSNFDHVVDYVSNSAMDDAVNTYSIQDHTSTASYLNANNVSTTNVLLKHDASDFPHVASSMSSTSMLDVSNTSSVQNGVATVTYSTTNDLSSTLTMLSNVSDFNGASDSYPTENITTNLSPAWGNVSRSYRTVLSSYPTPSDESTSLHSFYSTLKRLSTKQDFDIDQRIKNISERSAEGLPTVSSQSECGADYTPDYVEEVQYTIYSVIIPLLICLGLIANIFSIAVLIKPRMRSAHVNKYFLVLAISDLMVCLMYIPIAALTNGCSISSYSDAFYYTHFGWSLIEVCQMISFYIILFLSYDRFMAVWYHHRFKETQTNKVIVTRVTVTVIVDVLVHLFFFINASVSYKTKNTTGDREEYIFEDVYRFNDHHDWHMVLIVLNEAVVRWIPGVLLVVFNVGLVAAIAMGRLNNPASSLRGGNNRKEFRLTITLVIITAWFIICTFPNAVFVVSYASNLDDKCYGCHEVFRGVANILHLFVHVIDIVFLGLLNRSFRNEFVSLFTCKDPPEIPSEGFQSSRDLHLNEVKRQSGHSPFPSRANEV